MTIKHLAYRVAHDSALGIASLAEAMGLSHQTLTNFLNVNSDTHNLNINRFEMLIDFSNGNLQAAEYFASKANAVVVPLPVDNIASDMSLLDAFMNSVIAGGEFAQEFNRAFADGRVTPREFETIKKTVHDAIASQLAILNRIEQVVR